MTRRPVRVWIMRQEDLLPAYLLHYPSQMQIPSKDTSALGFTVMVSKNQNHLAAPNLLTPITWPLPCKVSENKESISPPNHCIDAVQQHLVPFIHSEWARPSKVLVELLVLKMCIRCEKRLHLTLYCNKQKYRVILSRPYHTPAPLESCRRSNPNVSFCLGAKFERTTYPSICSKRHL